MKNKIKVAANKKHVTEEQCPDQVYMADFDIKGFDADFTAMIVIPEEIPAYVIVALKSEDGFLPDCEDEHPFGTEDDPLHALVSEKAMEKVKELVPEDELDEFWSQLRHGLVEDAKRGKFDRIVPKPDCDSAEPHVVH